MEGLEEATISKGGRPILLAVGTEACLELGLERYGRKSSGADVSAETAICFSVFVALISTVAVACSPSLIGDWLNEVTWVTMVCVLVSVFNAPSLFTYSRKCATSLVQIADR